MIVATYFRVASATNGSIAVREVNSLSDLLEPDGWYTVSPLLFTDTELAWLNTGQTVYLNQAHERYQELYATVHPNRGRRESTTRDHLNHNLRAKWRNR